MDVTEKSVLIGDQADRPSRERLPLSRVAARAALVALIGCAVVGLAPQASEAAPTASNLLRANSMYNGQSFTRNSTSGAVGYWTLAFANGELVETAHPGFGRPSRVCWRTSTTRGKGYRATYQGDGNFVIYNAGGSYLWASNTVGTPGENVNINQVGRIYVGQQPISGVCGL